MNPTQLTLRELRKRGGYVSKVEYWNNFANRRIDAFGIIDVLYLPPEGPLQGIQVTSYTNHAARRNKAQSKPELEAWKKSGCEFWIHSWRKVKNRWVLREEKL